MNLVPINDPILSTVMPSVGDVDLTQVSKDMFETMWSLGGIGLAAPQIGLTLRMFVMGEQQGSNYVCINPEVMDVSKDFEINLEGCLSYPALWLNIKRPKWIQTRYRTLTGELVEQYFEGLLARCYLHELDHLNGIVFTKYVGQLSLKMAQERQKKRNGLRAKQNRNA